MTTPADRAMLRDVVRGARKAGMRVPAVRLRVVPHLGEHHGYARGGLIVVERASLTTELLCHELAHVIAGQVATDRAAAHGRFWALVYGVLYQQMVQN